MSETPLIWAPTLERNIPIEDLKLEVVWEDTEDYVKCSLNWYFEGQLVRCSAHAKSKIGLPFGAEQAQM